MASYYLPCTTDGPIMHGLRLLLLLMVAVPALAARLALQLAAAFDPHNYALFAKMLNKTVAAVNRDRRGINVTVIGSAMPLADFSAVSLEQVCAAVEQQRVGVFLALTDARAAHAVAMAAGVAGVPVVGIKSHLFLGHADKGLSPYYVGLGPSVGQLAEAMRRLLVFSQWHTFTVITDDSPGMYAVRREWEAALNIRGEVGVWSGEDDEDDEPDDAVAVGYPGAFGSTMAASATLMPTFVTVRDDADQYSLFHKLSDLNKLTQGVIVLLCDPGVVERLFLAAHKLHMLSGDWVWILVQAVHTTKVLQLPEPQEYPVGLLALRARELDLTKSMVKSAVRLIADAVEAPKVKEALTKWEGAGNEIGTASCWEEPSTMRKAFADALTRELRTRIDLATGSSQLTTLATPTALEPRPKGVNIGGIAPSGMAIFDLLNLVHMESGQKVWRPVGTITPKGLHLETIIWPGGKITAPVADGKKVYRVVTIWAPPFMMEEVMETNFTCIKGRTCLRIKTADKDNITLIFADYERGINQGLHYEVTCCYGFAMDLLLSVSKELHFDFHLYVVADGWSGAKRGTKWNGMVADLVAGAAHMSFAPLSVISTRSEVIDFSVPFLYSGISFVQAASCYYDVPLLAFLVPFSPELWIAILISLNITAIAVAIYEWLSPFGLNPWGRQRTKNFNIASALWVMWGLLFSHLVAFKAPKSWPNKFLINVWGGFSVIFVASYTAKIAALFAGFFFQRVVNDFHDRSLLAQRVGSVRNSAADFYINRVNPVLWEHMQKFAVSSLQEGTEKLRNGSLDILIGDSPILDYYIGHNPGCKLCKVGISGETIEDSYAIGMTKGFPLKDTVSTLIAKYTENGHLDYLRGKWYGSLPCLRLAADLPAPQPLDVESVAGVFTMLGVGMIVGCFILVLEHLVYKHALPVLRNKPKGTIWRSPNLMFFSQKLYRFINCVELVSPHHAAKELVSTIRAGQITSLFQKSVKRKENEQRRRRKSKAQFFEMIQEIRRVQKLEREQSTVTEEIFTIQSEPEEGDIIRPGALKKENPGRRDSSERDKLVKHVCLRLPSSGGSPEVFQVIPGEDSERRGGDGEEDVVEEEEQQPLSGASPSSSGSSRSSRHSAGVGAPSGVEGLPAPPSPFQPSPSFLERRWRKQPLAATSSNATDPGEGRSRAPSFQEEEVRLRFYPSLEDVRGGFSPGYEESGRKSSAEISSDTSPVLCSVIDDANLCALSKEEIISLWRTSELDLRRQLFRALQQREELVQRVRQLEKDLPEPP